MKRDEALANFDLQQVLHSAGIAAVSMKRA